MGMGNVALLNKTTSMTEEMQGLEDLNYVIKLIYCNLEIKKKLDRKDNNIAKYPQLKPEIIQRINLEIETTIMPCVIDMFNANITKSSDELYDWDEFIDDINAQGFVWLKNFWEIYKGLKEIVERSCSDVIKMYYQILKAVSSEGEEINNLLGSRNFNVKSIDIGLGDKHNGKTVAKIFLMLGN